MFFFFTFSFWQHDQILEHVRGPCALLPSFLDSLSFTIHCDSDESMYGNGESFLLCFILLVRFVCSFLSVSPIPTSFRCICPSFRVRRSFSFLLVRFATCPSYSSYLLEILGNKRTDGLHFRRFACRVPSTLLFVSCFSL